jgi:ADP-heptose:LPS heptosyltransferase
VKDKTISDIKNILIYRLGSLGDTIIALPCFHKIRESFPHAQITLLTNNPINGKATPIEALIGKGYFIDQSITYPIGTRNPILLTKLFKKIRSLNIDVLFYLPEVRTKTAVYRDRWFFKLAGIKHLVGFPILEKDFKLSIDSSTGEYEWEAQRLARRISSIGSINLQDSHYWDLLLTTEEKSFTDHILINSFANIPLFVISTGTKLQVKDWGTENWLSLIKELKKKLAGWKLVIIGANEDSYLANDLLNVWDGLGLNLCGRVSPRISAAILQKSKIFIGHDSGPMHLAASVGTKCVAIFSARNLPQQWFPRGNNKVIYNMTSCAGCGLDICIHHKKKCIMSITVNEVLQAVQDCIDG